MQQLEAEMQQHMKQCTNRGGLLARKYEAN